MKHALQIDSQLLKFWQRKNYHINRNEAKILIDINDLESQVTLLRSVGITVLSETRHDLGEFFNRYYLKCTCRIIGGNDVKEGCWVHDVKLKVVS